VNPREMDSLETAARKAKQFQKNKEDLKNLEITNALYQLDRINEESNTTAKRIEELQEELIKSTTLLDQSEAAITKERVNQDERERHIYDKNLSILESDKQINASDNLISSEQEKQQEFARLEKKAVDQIEVLEPELTALQKKYEEANELIQSSRERRQQLHDIYEEQKQSWKVLESERTELESKKTEISGDSLKVITEISQATNDKNSSESLTIHKQSELGSLKRELERSSDEHQKLSQTLSEQEQNIGHLEQSRVENTKQLDALKLHGSAIENKAQEHHRQTESLRLALTQNEAQLQMISKNFEEDPYRKGTQNILKQGFTGLKGVTGLLFKYSENNAQWIESILGNKINFLVFERLEEAQNALDWLKENGLGRAGCIILEKITEITPPDLSSLPNANSLLSFVQCSPELEKLKRTLFGSAFLTGNTLYDNGVIDGGSEFPSRNPSPEDSQGSLQNDFLFKEKLENEISRLKQEWQATEQEWNKAQEEAARNKPTLSEKEREIEKLNIQINHFHELSAQKKGEDEICLREISLYQEKIESEEKELREILARVELLQFEEDRLNQVQQQKDRERIELQTLIDDKIKQEHTSQLVAKESEVRLETFSSELEQTEENLRELSNRSERVEKDIETTRREIEDLHVRIGESQKRAQVESKNIAQYQSQKSNETALLENLLLQKSEWEEKNRGSLTRIQEIREKQTRLTESLHHIEMDMRTFENEKKGIITKMEETYQISPLQAREQFTPNSVELEEIVKLRKRVENMSNSVNLEAPEQHQGLMDRYNFLSSQTQDLIKARQDLQSAIQQINNSTRTQFKETFIKVRENFRSVYRTLFAGGEADLIFTDENNVLDTGVDIVAQPPGKKLQNIALLSGGEKALTAIALLFAFFMVKPSPFCVLDEVDAPWDQANVDRFLNLLKEFSQKVQFIVVTHNTRTMEIADILYGVTMQDFGISKIISAKLKKESGTPVQNSGEAENQKKLNFLGKLFEQI